MISLKELFIQLLEKRGFNMTSNPDSIWSRSSAARAGTTNKEKGPNKQQASGADIADKMDFDDEPHRSPMDAQPESALDLTFQTWGLGPKKRLKK